jgi:hypothetical protein
VEIQEDAAPFKKGMLCCILLDFRALPRKFFITPEGFCAASDKMTSRPLVFTSMAFLALNLPKKKEDWVQEK